MDLKERVKGEVTFVRYQNNVLIYSCEDGFEFPVPLEDAKAYNEGAIKFHKEFARLNVW